VINSHLTRGASVVLTGESFVSPTFWNLMREQECDSLAGVPYSYQMLDRLKLDGLNVPGIRTLTQAGGKLGPELIAKFHRIMTDRGGRFFTMYGQTEATARIAVLPAEMLPERLGAVGFAIPGGSLAIGSGGEIIYSGPNVMLGYAENRADLALGDAQGGTLRTGDLGHLDPDGCLWITGRLKREAKLFGLRVNLDDLEAMIRVHGPAAVVGRADRLSIFCEFEEALFPLCRDELASKLRVHARAFEFHRIDRLPTNGAGKIDYSALEVAR
jgi:long-chain acyl-CoA synthetase